MHDVERLYRFRFSETDLVRKSEIWQVLCEDFFQKYIASTDTVLDIGCGFGEFSTHIRAGRRIAIDLNADAGKHLPAGVEFHATSAADLSVIPDTSIDVCFSSNFFEHLPSRDALDRVLAEALRVLRPGGRYVAMQPNIRYAPGEYWDYYDHVLPLSHLSCREAFAKAGFEICQVIDRFVPFSTNSRLPQHPWLVRAYLRCRWAWRILGRQFVIVGRKPTTAGVG